MYPNYYIDFALQTGMPPQIICNRSGTTANHFNRSGRLIQSTENALRITADGLLIEPKSTNLFDYSRDLTTWTATGTGTIGTAVSLDGSLRNIKVSSLGTGATYTLEEMIILSAGTYTLSFYAENISLSNVQLRCEFGGQTIYISGNKRRYQVTGINPTSVKFTAVVGAFSNSSIIIDAVQIESGTQGTSPIHTNGSTVTRNADEVYMNITQTAANNWFTPLNGTILIDSTTNKLTSQQTLLHFVNTSSGSTDYIRLGVDRSSGTQVNMGYNDSKNYSFFSSCDNPGQTFRVGTTYTDGEQLVSLVGRTNTSGSSTQTIDLTDINRMYIGRLDNGTNHFCGVIRRFGFYAAKLDQIDLNNLTNI